MSFDTHILFFFGVPYLHTPAGVSTGVKKKYNIIYDTYIYRVWSMDTPAWVRKKNIEKQI